jgi:5-methylcytosine-specific restriction enzyme A
MTGVYMRGRGPGGVTYGEWRWRKLRARFLRQHPLCVFCKQRGIVSAAVVVDHIEGHSGLRDPAFWRPSNLQGLCFRCHDSTKQQLDRKGWARGCDALGNPLYPRESFPSPTSPRSSSPTSPTITVKSTHAKMHGASK